MSYNPYSKQQELQINKKFDKGTSKKVDTNWFKKFGSKIAQNFGQNFAGAKQTPNSQMDEIRKRHEETFSQDVEYLFLVLIEIGIWTMNRQSAQT